ncbi:MAG: hypothetical protein IT550_06085 [Novosphingobium sp.]|nr:hypothetical protein [Novosphingobium sp.]
MADVWTALIAGITGAAGLSGGFVAGKFNLKSVAKTHRRDDLAALRGKFEELYAELDHVQNLSNSLSAQIMVAMNDKKAPSQPTEPVNLGKIKSIVRLYFPTCEPAIAALEQREVEETKKLRDGNKADPISAFLFYAMHQNASTLRMCSDVRDLLAAQAENIGRSVRDSLASHDEDGIRKVRAINIRSGFARLAVVLVVPYFGYWASAAWLADRALPMYLAQSRKASTAGDWKTSTMWMERANQVDRQFQASLQWGLAVPTLILILAAISYWIYRGFKAKPK